jgi:hypothetical protein
MAHNSEKATVGCLTRKMMRSRNHDKVSRPFDTRQPSWHSRRRLRRRRLLALANQYRRHQPINLSRLRTRPESNRTFLSSLFVIIICRCTADGPIPRVIMEFRTLTELVCAGVVLVQRPSGCATTVCSGTAPNLRKQHVATSCALTVNAWRNSGSRFEERVDGGAEREGICTTENATNATRTLSLL